jgi:hypothetical protein
MKMAIVAVATLVSFGAFGQNVPVITASPTNLTVYPGSNAVFNVTATAATDYQWIFQGKLLPGATNATLQITNAQSTNSGYYLAIAKNAAGWAPSQMAYLFLDYTFGGTQSTSCGVLPYLYNTNFNYVDATVFNSPTNAIVTFVDGPELDELSEPGDQIPYQPSSYTIPGLPWTFTNPTWFYNGLYYDSSVQTDPVVAPGQTVYYFVSANNTNDGGYFIEPSTFLRLTAGTNGLTPPSSFGLKFPGWEPTDGGVTLDSQPISQQLRVLGESFSIEFGYEGYTDFGPFTNQWRKNGVFVPGATNSTVIGGPEFWGEWVASLTITNCQPSDAGIYDMLVYGPDWVMTEKVAVSVQTTNGQGVFQTPQFSGTNFICNLIGAPGRSYDVQWSTNLTSWNDLATNSSTTGTFAFTNGLPGGGAMFYRTVLLP